MLQRVPTACVDSRTLRHGYHSTMLRKRNLVRPRTLEWTPIVACATTIARHIVKWRGHMHIHTLRSRLGFRKPKSSSFAWLWSRPSLNMGDVHAGLTLILGLTMRYGTNFEFSSICYTQPKWGWSEIWGKMTVKYVIPGYVFFWKPGSYICVSAMESNISIAEEHFARSFTRPCASVFALPIRNPICLYRAHE